MTVGVEIQARVQVITLDRPDALNAFNDEMYKAVADALDAAAADVNVSVSVITGAGRAFSAGQDLAEMADPKRQQAEYEGQFPGFIRAVSAFPKPLLAAVNGIGVGIGLTLLPHCDLVYMAGSARLRAPFAALGVTVEAGNSYLLPRALGWANAAELLFTGRWIGALEAQEMGLVYRVSEDQDLMRDVLAKAAEMALMPLVSLVTTKKLLIEHRQKGISQARKSEDQAFRELTGAPANREAIAAFKEKREPDFSNLDRP